VLSIDTIKTAQRASIARHAGGAVRRGFPRDSIHPPQFRVQLI